MRIFLKLVKPNSAAGPDDINVQCSELLFVLFIDDRLVGVSGGAAIALCAHASKLGGS